MQTPPRTWRDELKIVDDTMKAISGVSDPEQLVDIYWNGIGELIPYNDYVAVSRRGEPEGFYRVTRSSRFTEHPNPWTERHKLPLLSGGVLGEIAFAESPVIIEDLPSRLDPADPAWFYLQGFATIMAMPQYDDGKALNVTALLLPADHGLKESMIPMLHWQAGLFGRGTQNLVLRNQLAAAHAALDRELKIVSDIQRSLLPPHLPAIPGMELAASYTPCTRAGGDYYDFLPLSDGRWGILIADVSGHGSPAAVLMAMMWAVLHAQTSVHPHPSELLRYLNTEFLRSYTRGGDFITVFYAVLDPATRRLTHATAGHNPPRLLRGNRVQPVESEGGPPLGVLPDFSYNEATVDLQPGDQLLLYTDGISEAMGHAAPNGSRAMFGVERIDAVMEARCASSASELIDLLRTAVAQFAAGAPAQDDQTLVALNCL